MSAHSKRSITIGSLLIIAIAGTFYACAGTNRASTLTTGDAASKVYVAPGSYDEFYAFLSGGRIACAFEQGGEPHLGLLDPGEPLRDLELAIDAPYLRSDGRRLLMIGLTASEFPAVFALDPGVGEPEVLYRVRERNLDHRFLCTAKRIEFPTEEGRTAHAFWTSLSESLPRAATSSL